MDLCIGSASAGHCSSLDLITTIKPIIRGSGWFLLASVSTTRTDPPPLFLPQTGLFVVDNATEANASLGVDRGADDVGGMSADVPAGLGENLVIAVPLGIALYGLSFLTFLGNALVLHAIRTDRRLQTVSNMFILSLASADLTVGIIVMPISAAYAITGEWKFGLYVCQLWLSMDYSASTASILNLFILSLDRYWSITTPLKYLRKRTKKRACVMIGIVWLVSLTWLVPILSWHILFFGGVRRQHMSLQHPLCETEFANNVPFKVSTAILNFYIPSAAMLYLYGRMFYAIEQRTKLEVDREPSSSHNPSMVLRNNHNINEHCFGQEDGLRRNFAMSNRSFRSPMMTGSTRRFRWSSSRRPGSAGSGSPVDVVVTCRDGTNVALQELPPVANSIRNNSDDHGRRVDDEDAGSSSPDSFSTAPATKEAAGATPKSNKAPDASSKKKNNNKRKGITASGHPLSVLKESSSGTITDRPAPSQSTTATHPPSSIFFGFVKNPANVHQASTAKDGLADDAAVVVRIDPVSSTHDINTEFDREVKNPHFYDFGDDNGDLSACHRLKPPTDHSNHLQCYSSRRRCYSNRNKATSLRVPSTTVMTSQQQQLLPRVRNAKREDNSIMTSSASSPLLSPSSSSSITRTNSITCHNNHNSSSSLMATSTVTLCATSSSSSKPGSSTPRLLTTIAASNRSSMRGGGYRHQYGDQHGGGGGGMLIRERKAAKQLGVIMSAFIMCWLPYFITFMVIAYCPDCISPQVHQATIWLGYLNSTLNPFLYPLCNANFKRAFKRIFRMQEAA